MANQKALLRVFSSGASCGSGWHSRAAAVEACARPTMKDTSANRALRALVKAGDLRERDERNAKRYCRSGWRGDAPPPGASRAAGATRGGVFAGARRQTHTRAALRRRR